MTRRNPPLIWAHIFSVEPRWTTWNSATAGSRARARMGRVGGRCRLGYLGTSVWKPHGLPIENITKDTRSAKFGIQNFFRLNMSWRTWPTRLGVEHGGPRVAISVGGGWFHASHPLVNQHVFSLLRLRLRRFYMEFPWYFPSSTPRRYPSLHESPVLTWNPQFGWLEVKFPHGILV